MHQDRRVRGEVAGWTLLHRAVVRVDPDSLSVQISARPKSIPCLSGDKAHGQGDNLGDGVCRAMPTGLPHGV